MNMKKYLYAAVGAQVAVAKSAQTKLEQLMSRVNDNASSARADVKGRIDVWADEGEEFLSQVTDAKAIDELTSKVDFDQVQTQVNKLRDQLEDIVATWRANFRPETKPVEKVTATESGSAPATTPKSATTPAVTAPAAKTATARTSAATASAAKASAANAAAATPTEAKPATKKPAAKKPAAKKPVAKKPAAKAPAAKNPAAKSTPKTATDEKGADQKAS